MGHVRHGVSVYNGKQWINYDVVGGADQPGSLSGPLGEHVTAIKVCPKNGDVWMATSAGLARYQQTDDRWVYYTRAGGLPGDQVISMAFDARGNLYCATGCDGMLMIDASDNYTKTRQIRGPETISSSPQGSGLPTNLINDVLVARDGTIYAGTCDGLAWSNDEGTHWQYVRGKDWAEKVKNSAAGPPPEWDESKHGPLIEEDYVTCLGEDARGALLIGSRGHGWCTFSRRRYGFVNARQRHQKLRQMLPARALSPFCCRHVWQWFNPIGFGAIKNSGPPAAAIPSSCGQNNGFSRIECRAGRGRPRAAIKGRCGTPGRLPSG